MNKMGLIKHIINVNFFEKNVLSLFVYKLR